ncbi:hypothetical protein GCM10007887_31050 [Methylobacterium haplocladii]|uniref:Uncharacterized protein n=1 Tax=Methylobacterium haplocladii TaxID=1176176 RepID=A0A512IUF5_9HYPH|nr:hypothetical protein MHA02_36830 [Methylobacterium haplocladii]GLS60426.1 hypothetical protein GCM10007887_31050 [Methylobacterium haplocladii]
MRTDRFEPRTTQASYDPAATTESLPVFPACSLACEQPLRDLRTDGCNPDASRGPEMGRAVQPTSAVRQVPNSVTMPMVMMNFRSSIRWLMAVSLGGRLNTAH